MRTVLGVAVLCAVGMAITRQYVALSVIAVTTALVVWGDLILSLRRLRAENRRQRG